ncbi:MAG: ABC transporter permease [Acidimicrobiales bacterium]
MTTVEDVMPQAPSDFDCLIMAERQRKRRRDTTWVVIISVFALGAFVGAWEAVHASGLIKPIFVSDPISVAKAFWYFMTTASSWTDIWSTFEASLGGLIIGGALGIACGIVFAHVPVLRRAMNPYLTLFNALPRPALAPIFILWFGLGEIPKIAVAVSIVFFVLLINTMAGLSSVDPDIAFLARSLTMTRWQRFHMVELPHAAPAIVAGLRLGAVYSVLGVVVSEIVAANHGLGQVLVKDTNEFAIPASFAALATMALLATILDLGVRAIQKRFSWSENSQSQS